MSAINNSGFKLTEHPSYSPDLASLDFHLFQKLKMALNNIKLPVVSVNTSTMFQPSYVSVLIPPACTIDVKGKEMAKLGQFTCCDFAAYANCSLQNKLQIYTAYVHIRRHNLP